MPDSRPAVLLDPHSLDHGLASGEHADPTPTADGSAVDVHVARALDDFDSLGGSGGAREGEAIQVDRHVVSRDGDTVPSPPPARSNNR